MGGGREEGVVEKERGEKEGREEERKERRVRGKGKR